jgi:uncharacterized protein (TIGR02680 family)
MSTSFPDQIADREGRGLAAMPLPQRERWQPLRLGLVDLFYYDQEEFAFRDGRLLLRGNNGTGKSKVLALTLPFLLDGDLSPHRVEPDADPKKRMEWNLLLGGEYPSEDRLGYTWIEFGRLQHDGAPAFCTIGCGLKAAKGRGITAHWYFVTEQRIGEQLALLDGTGTALTRDRLDAEIGSAGSVYKTAGDYRRAVDERLFGLGEQRYRALVDLLIKIRAPQLSKRPDERGLSSALTEAQPPLDQALIADVAEAFRALEEDGEALAAMIEARDASVRYLETYRVYAQMATRRRAAPLRQTQSTFDRVSRELAEAQAAHQGAQAERARATAALAELRAEDNVLRTRQQALRDSPEARSARELARAAEEARVATGRVAEATAASERLERRVTSLSTRLADADARRAHADAELVTARQGAIDHAGAARVERPFTDDVAQALEDVERDELRRRAEQIGNRQQSAIDRVRTLIASWEESRRELAHARQRTEQLASEEGDLADRRTHAVAELSGTSVGYVTAVREHLEAATELTLQDPAETLAALELWVETLAGTNPLELAASAAGRSVAAALERARAELRSEETTAQELAEQLDATIARLQSGEHDPPPAPYTRGAEVREHRPGAPLWQVIDFRAEIDPRERAGIEAALEVAGILDAWVTPDGQLLSAETDDVLVAPDAHAPPTGRCLADVFVPARDRGDPQAAGLGDRPVDQILGAIGLGEGGGSVWITRDGQFRNGILRGAWHKPEAVFIGHGAREAARRARLQELRAERAAIAEELGGLGRRLEDLDGRRVRLEREVTELPDDSGVRDAHARVSQIEAEISALTVKLTAAREHERAREVAERAAELELRTDAEDLHLPTAEAELEPVQAALREFRVALAGLWPTLSQRDRAHEESARARGDLDETEGERVDAGERLKEAEREQASCAEREATLRRTAGAAIAELEHHLAEVAKGLRENERRRGDTEAQQSQALLDEGSADGLRQELQRELDRVTDERLTAVDQLRRFAGTGLIQVALETIDLPDPAEEWGVTLALRLARQLEQELAAVTDDDQPWQRAQQRVNDELGMLADALRRHGNNASASLREEGIVVEVTFRGHTTGLPALAQALSAEVHDRQRLLDEREREILENHLVNEVASTLQELISAAERRLADTNAELAERPTSTGMQLRLRWVPDPGGPNGLVEARARLLRQSADAWSEEDRAAVGGFLQARIQEVRAQDATGTWIEHLTEALDYRRWHRFTVERRQAGGWRAASGPSSGGERVLAASVPLFAAASSYYTSAGHAHAPRIVMLDEAFAGVDDSARAKCLGLLAAFDLDVVMTSEREWGCYADVPGLAIAQLSRVEDIPAVLVTRWEWDGATRRRVESTPEPIAVAHAPDPDDGPRLWETSTTSG